MDQDQLATLPDACPACSGELAVTRLQCLRCDTEVTGQFSPSRLVNIPEPYASVLELFLRVRGNVKDMERQLGLSYPTIRARLDEAFDAAGLGRQTEADSAEDQQRRRADIVRQLNDGAISAADAITQLRELKEKEQV